VVILRSGLYSGSDVRSGEEENDEIHRDTEDFVESGRHGSG
jgi:hypothetical protein